MTRRQLLALLAVPVPELGGRGCIVKDARTIRTWAAQSQRREVISSSKPVLNTLLFFAIQEKKIPWLNARIADFGLELGPKDRTLTDAHPTSMTSGYGRPDFFRLGQGLDIGQPLFAATFVSAKGESGFRQESSPGQPRVNAMHAPWLFPPLDAATVRRCQTAL